MPKHNHQPSLLDEFQDMGNVEGLIPPLTPDMSSIASNASVSPKTVHTCPSNWQTAFKATYITGGRIPSPLRKTVKFDSTSNDVRGVGGTLYHEQAASSNQRPISSGSARQGWGPNNTPWNSISNEAISSTGLTSGLLPDTGLEHLFEPLWNRFQDLRLLNREKHAFAEVCKVLINDSRQIPPEREQDLLARLESCNTQLQRYRQQEREARKRELELARRVEDLENSAIRLTKGEDHVVAVIDAVTQPFSRELVAQGEHGGRRAADLLQATIAAAMQTSSNLPFPKNKIIIRVYAEEDVPLDKALSKGFIDGFNAVGSRIDLVAGPQFREKFTENCLLALKHQWCLQLFIGGFGIETSTSFRQQLDGVPNSKDRMTLLLDASSSLPQSWGTYRIHSIENLFSPLELPKSAKAKPETPNSPASSSPRPTQAAVPPSATWADRAAKAAALTDISNTASKPRTSSNAAPNPQTSSNTNVFAKSPETPLPSPAPHSRQRSTSSSADSACILKNSHGQRIDPVVPHDKDEVNRVKKLKLCNAHHLKRFCRSGKECYHDHTYKPTPAELKTLEHVARMSPCEYGSECDDVYCYHGHCCPAPKGRNGELCIFGDKCYFPDDMHNVDRT